MTTAIQNLQFSIDGAIAAGSSIVGIPINEALAVLSALKGQEWLPIESCPKGGDYILVRLADRLVEEGDSPVALVRHLAEVWFESDGGVEYDLSQLTHWRPLPTPPEGVAL